MNIDALILSVIVMTITALTYCWGYRNGLSLGYQLGLADGKQQSLCFPDTFATRTELPMRKIQCCYDVRITDDMHPEEIINNTTSAVYGLSTYLVQELIAQKLARPVFIDGDIRPYRDTRRLCISFFVARDPAFDGYPDAVIFSRANSI